MSKGVRERVWAVLADWHGQLGGGAILMTWSDPAEPCGQGIHTRGLPSRTFVELDGGLITTVTRKA
jgi:CRISPR-associated protein Cas2